MCFYDYKVSFDIACLDRACPVSARFAGATTRGPLPDTTGFILVRSYVDHHKSRFETKRRQRQEGLQEDIPTYTKDRGESN
jgi:hypothetical protein